MSGIFLTSKLIRKLRHGFFTPCSTVLSSLPKPLLPFVFLSFFATFPTGVYCAGCLDSVSESCLRCSMVRSGDAMALGGGQCEHCGTVWS